MSVLLDDETNRVVKELAETSSKHAKYVNQVWFASILASSVFTFPTIKDGKYVLPFSLGEVEKSVYLPVALLILSVLIIAYCQGYAKAYDSRRFAQKILDELENKSPDVREFYDFFIVESIARVWPLVSLLRYKYKFGICLSKLFYLALKVLTQGILLALPIVALSFVYWRFLEAGASGVIFWSATIALMFVAIAVVEIIFAEIDVTNRVFKRLEKIR